MSSDMSNDAVCRFTCSWSWNYLWIVLLVALFKCLPSVKAQSFILLPSQLHHDSLISSPPSCPAPNPNLYYQPVIGILSHPGDGASGRLSNATNASYIAASYVKFAESAGARVIPLIYNEPPEKLFKKLDLVNGVLFTGGWAKSGLYFETVGTIFKKVLEKNDAGDHFPLYAVCLGFELLTMVISQDNNILEEFSAVNQAGTLQFAENANIEGTVFQRFPPDLLKKLSTDCLVMQNHRLICFGQVYGTTPEFRGTGEPLTMTHWTKWMVLIHMESFILCSKLHNDLLLPSASSTAGPSSTAPLHLMHVPHSSQSFQPFEHIQMQRVSLKSETLFSQLIELLTSRLLSFKPFPMSTTKSGSGSNDPKLSTLNLIRTDWKQRIYFNFDLFAFIFFLKQLISLHLQLFFFSFSIVTGSVI